MKKDLNIYLEIILDAINQIMEYSRDLNFEEFVSEKMRVDACLMQFQHLWETALKVRKHYWKLWLPLDDVVWFRNFIAHEYLWIKIDVVWETIKFDLPNLKIEVLNIKKLSSIES